MSTPDLLYGEAEEDLRKNVRRLLQQRCDWTAVLARCESDQPYDLDLWSTLSGELGVAGLTVPEELGGAEASTRELAVLAEELGRSVAPVPFLGSAVLATTALLGCSSADARETVVALAEGSRIGTVAVPLTTTPGSAFPMSVNARDGALTGTVHTVVDLPVADIAVVPAIDEEGQALYLLDLASPGVTRTSATPLDLTRRFATLDLDGATGLRIAASDSAEAALQHALVTATGILASEQTGLAQLCLDSTVEYVLTRYQFGRQIGSFQAVKHRLADLWAGVSTARAAARGAADALATLDGDVGLSAALAQAYCGDLVVSAAEEFLQLHGGIGMTWEHPAHLYLGRAKSSQLTFGTAERHRARIAELGHIPAP
ncbi:acyl-CoA dehydrogenase family protein [Haloactinomyces albus]|uniref:Alkylation response protein AidB-like acyl-CoA dehydrogenase n=1 Tax=Haloactinomyces albus TaxID=1352928 RepID=A0AAE4CK44_9ACTN|nr:acyl-CoA dehydrogenase family protein [Haloactinomyces albus]MDR7300369.1 alkylation response protein AidB-like acyl-CoA dehydrogenase [Haloactinomyces albus]